MTVSCIATQNNAVESNELRVVRFETLANMMAWLDFSEQAVEHSYDVGQFGQQGNKLFLRQVTYFLCACELGFEFRCRSDCDIKMACKGSV